MKTWLPGLLATLLTWGGRQALDGWLGGSHFLLPYTLPIMVGAFWGGWRGGLATTLLNCLLGLSYLAWTPQDLSRLGILALNGVFMSWLCQRVRERQQDLESRFQAIFHSQLHFIGLLSVDGRILECNDTAVRVTGERREDILGLPMWEAPWWRHEPALQKRHQEAVAQAAAGVQVSFAATYCTFSGEVRWVDYTLTPFRDDKGRILYLIPEGHDITELRLQEENFRQAFECAAIGKALVSLEGRWVRVNRALCELTGYTSEELLAIDFQTITHPDDLAQDLALVGSVLAGERTSYHLEKRYFHKLGHVVHILLTVALVRDAEANPLYFIAQIQDISEQKEARERLLAGLREKELMLKEIHHRVKNNLQVVSTLLDLQSSHTQDPAALAMFAESRARVRSMAMVHERLYRSHDLERVDFHDYLTRLGEDLYHSYLVEPEEVLLRLEVDVPPLPISVAIPCGLLINELLSNCLKHAFPEPHADSWIEVSLRPADGHHQLVVADNGSGMPAALDFRDTSSFGLQLVNTLVEQLHGSIELVPAGGTRFQVNIPQWRTAA